MKRKKKKKKRHLFRIILLFLIVFISLSIMEHQLVPPLKEISHMQCKTIANQIIDTSAWEILNEIELTPLLYSSEVNGAYQANTILVNQFCSLFSARITDGMKKLEKEQIYIPIGAVTGWSYLANTGPEIPFTLLPMGSVKVDYSSDFLSVGINQINYKIWLDISMELKIVNPLYQETLLMHRKIMLADIVFSGKVPEQYFQITPQNEYLLTE